jgi:hypothetical protein
MQAVGALVVQESRSETMDPAKSDSDFLAQPDAAAAA